MPMPRWWGQINKRVFNPRALASGKWPVLTHTGRTSGATYGTPLDAHPVEGGYLFFLVYGSGSDWVRNILTTGRAHLSVNGQEFDLCSPRIVGRDEAFQALSGDVARPPRVLALTEFLRMDTVVD